MWDKLWEAIQKYGGSARDARIGAVGVDQVRDLYKSNKQEDKELAKELNDRYLTANAAGIGGGATAASALTAGVVPTLVSEVSGAVGSYAAGKAGSYLDEQFGTQWISPTLSFLGGLGGGIAGYKILKPSYNYLAKNGVIGYKDVPKDLINLKYSDPVKWKQTYDPRREYWRLQANKSVAGGEYIGDGIYQLTDGRFNGKLIHQGDLNIKGTKLIPKQVNEDKILQTYGNRSKPTTAIWWNENIPYYSSHDKMFVIDNKIKTQSALDVTGYGQPGSVLSSEVDIANPELNFKFYRKSPETGLTTESIFVFPKQPSQGTTSYKFYERPSKQSSIASSSSGTELATPMEAIEEIKKGRAMAGSFFKHPVVKESYVHNQELAKRLGIDLPDRPADISDMATRPVKVGWNTSDHEIANVAQGYYGDPNVTMNFQWAKRPKSEWGSAARHESMHLGYYSAPVRPEVVTKDIYDNTVKPTAQFWNWKTQKLLKPEYKNGYLSDVWGGEAGPNLIDIGRDLGVKLGQKYPGDVEFLKMLDNYHGYKSFLVPQLATDTKAGRRHIWDAMTGKYFAAPLVGVSGAYTVSNEEN